MAFDTGNIRSEISDINPKFGRSIDSFIEEFPIPALLVNTYINNAKNVAYNFLVNNGNSNCCILAHINTQEDGVFFRSPVQRDILRYAEERDCEIINIGEGLPQCALNWDPDEISAFYYKKIVSHLTSCRNYAVIILPNNRNPLSTLNLKLFQ